MNKTELKSELKSILGRSRQVCENAKAAGRELTAAELAGVKADLKRCDEIDAQLKTMKEADAVWERAAAGYGTTTKGAGARWAKSVVDKMSETASGIGVKALVSGSIDTPPAVEVVALPEVPTRLLDLIPRQELAEATYAYLRQTVRTNNAAPVADGAEKPTSVYTFEEVEDRARVIAHLSEPFPVRYLEDHSSLTDVLNTQMIGGVWEAIEDLIVNGDGTGEEFTGILTVTGTTAVTFATDAVTTLRKARTALEVKGERVSAVAMNPADVEALDLLREDATAGTGGFLLDGSAYERILGQGVRGIPSNAVPEGTAILGDWGQTRLRVRQGVHTLAATQGGADESGDLFDTNRVKLRTEGRYGFDILRPQALAVVELAAAAG